MRTRLAAPVSVVIAFCVLALGSSTADSATLPTPKDTRASGEGGGQMVATQPSVPKATKGSTAVPTTGSTGNRPSQHTPDTKVTSEARNDPVTPEAASIAVFAHQLNGPAHKRALDDPDFGPATASDAWRVADNFWKSTDVLWQDVLDRFNLKGTPPKFRPLVYDANFEDQDATECPDQNAGKALVTSSSPAPFYCRTDGPSGTIYWPVKTMEHLWAKNGLPTSAMASGFALWMNQLYSEFIAVTAYDTWGSMKGAEYLYPPMPNVNKPISFCFAGTALQGIYLNEDDALAGTQLLGATMPGYKKEYASAARYGFEHDSLGDCVREYWPTNH